MRYVVDTNNHGIRGLDADADILDAQPWSYTYNPALLSLQPFISEFMADNDETLRDEDGDSSDWIEIHNPTDSPLDLAGWALSNDPHDPARWLFPRVALEPKSFLVVFASGKNRADPGARLHTSFKLSAGGGVLTLSNSARNIVSSFAYPKQRKDVSFGREQDNASAGFFTKATPGAPNSLTGPGFAPKVRFSRTGGTFGESFLLTLAADAPNAVIHYSTGNAKLAPSESSPVYTGPILITNTTHLRARAFVPGLLPGEPRSESYIALHDSARNATSDLPLVILHNYGGGNVPVSGEQFVMMQIFEPKNGVASLTNAPDFSERARFRLRGSSTQSYPKSSFALETWDEFNNDKKVEVLGMPEDSDWNFYAPNNFEPVLIHNPFMYQLSRDIGRYASRTRFVEVYLSTRGGVISASNYFGIYVIEEKIKRGANRVDIDKLEPEHLKQPELSGGYMLKIDRPDPGEGSFSAAGVSEWNFVDPKGPVIRTAARDPQERYIVGYLRTIGSVLNNTALFKDPVEGYAKYIDVPASIDHHMLNVLAFNVDALRLSTYLYKPRDGKLAWGPVWDFDRALGSRDGRDANPRTWGSTGGTSFFQYPMWNRMFQDPDFWQKWIDRWEELRLNQFSVTNLHRLIDDLTGEVRQAQPREYARWRFSAPVRISYQNEINLMKKYLADRTQYIDAQLVRPPVPSLHSGRVFRGSTLALGANDTVYYTLNGSDPRLPGGAISPGAQLYAGPITIQQNARVFARAYKPGHTGGPIPTVRSPWSGAAQVTCVVEGPHLAITEIMVHPAALSGNTNEAGNFEFIELANLGSQPVNLAGFSFTHGIEFTFPDADLAPGERILVVKNQAAFSARYGPGMRIAGEFSGSLDNSGERIRLVGPYTTVADFSYSNKSFPITDGHGFSLVHEDAAFSEAEPAGWRPSARLDGSPGAADPPPPKWPRVYVNEILSRSTGGGLDQIELFNDGAEAASIGGWFLTDDFSVPAKYEIPAGTIISPHGYAVFTEAQTKPGANGFALSAEGDEIYLFSAADGRLTGYVHGARFGAAAEGRAFARFVSRDGAEHFVPEVRQTFGAANAEPLIGPVVISEIMFQPPMAGTYDNTLDEYIELHNLSAAVVPLGSWNLRGGVEFAFPGDASLAPGGFGLVVNFDPVSSLRDGFFSRFAVPPGTPVFGPLKGKLGNSGDQVTLVQEQQEQSITIDEIDYGSDLPWPNNAAGTGLSLQRLDRSFGNDPFSWITAVPAPGRATTERDPDKDRDGLPDAWEAQHGLDPAVSAAMDDPDADGFTNLQEYIAGTDPINAASNLRIDAAGATLTFTAEPGKSYTILFKSSLAEPDWTRLSDVPASSERQTRVIEDGEPGAARFYRIVTPAVP